MCRYGDRVLRSAGMVQPGADSVAVSEPADVRDSARTVRPRAGFPAQRPASPNAVQRRLPDGCLSGQGGLF